MEKIQYPQALPGCCWLCRSSNREYYIDTQQSIDFYGAVYLCDKCIEEMASHFGMLSVVDAKNLQEANKDLEEDKFNLQVQVSGLEQAIDGLRIAGRIDVRTDSVRNSSLPVSEPTETVPGGEEFMGSERGTSDESSDDSDVGELHSNESGSDSPAFSLDL